MIDKILKARGRSNKWKRRYLKQKAYVEAYEEDMKRILEILDKIYDSKSEKEIYCYLLDIEHISKERTSEKSIWI